MPRLCPSSSSRTPRHGPQGRHRNLCAVWFGRGFDWGPEHAQKLYELSKIDVERLIPHRNICRRLTGTAPKDPRTVGLAAIDGLESSKKDIWVSEKTLEGGTLIVGTTQAGKGVLLTSLVTQAILRGEAVIVIDPKMSSRLKNAVTAAAKLANRSDPLFFHPNNPEGIRINPLTHFERPSEIASRLTAVMADSGPFTSFAWSAVNVVVNLLVHVGRTPSIAGIESVLTGDFEDLLLEAVELDCGPDLFDTLVSEVKLKGKKGRDGVLLLLDKARDREALSEATLKGAATYAHDPVHFSKITASLMPVLAMLTSGALRQTLSPADDDAEAMSLSEIIAQRKILYVCLNSLPDPTVAGAIGSLLLADLASCAGERYNDTSIARTTVSLFVDECSNVINRSLIEILNKGAESGLRTTLCHADGGRPCRPLGFHRRSANGDRQLQQPRESSHQGSPHAGIRGRNVRAHLHRQHRRHAHQRFGYGAPRTLHRRRLSSDHGFARRNHPLRRARQAPQLRVFRVSRGRPSCEGPHADSDCRRRLDLRLNPIVL